MISPQDEPNTNREEYEDAISKAPERLQMKIIDKVENQPTIEDMKNVYEPPPPVYCAKCYHSFYLPECESEDNDSDQDQDSEDDDSVSPIFREDPEDIEEFILEEIANHIHTTPLAIWRASYERDLIKDISTFLFEEWLEDDLCEEYDLPEIQEWTRRMLVYYFATESEMPPRQGGAPLATTPLRRVAIAKKLRILANIPAPPQRTQEWYEMRYGLLTASNVWKALGSEAQQNQLIVEKCIPFEKFKEDCARHGNLSADNPMAWGQKYEPISALIYESKNNTKLGEYGCIVHPEWEFLGASPDGINIEPESPVYGRMVEIKNIVNRDIDGIPLDAYWVQMQIQMEVADLDECDFVETRIKEVATREEFLESANPYKGVVLTFLPRITIESTMRNNQGFTESVGRGKSAGALGRKDDVGVLHENTMVTSLSIAKKSFYEYFLLSSEDANPDVKVNEWIQTMKDMHKEYVVASVVYWVLDQYSCVLVKRNRAWFNAAIPLMDKLWRTVERERVTGCEHRAPKKREPKVLADPKLLADPKVLADPKLLVNVTKFTESSECAQPQQTNSVKDIK